MPLGAPYMPEELIMIIFQHYIAPDDPPHDSDNSVIQYSSRCCADVIKLLRVNRTWRRVALDTRELWTSIYICNPSKEILTKYTGWMRISHQSRKNSLVDIELKLDGTLTELFLSETAKVLHSIRNLTINLVKCHIDSFAVPDSGGLIHLLRKFLCAHRNLPLERIHVKIANEIPTKRRKNLTEIWKHLSSLPSIQQIKWDYKLMVLPLTNSWNAANLTIVEARALQCCDLYWILSVSPRLEELRMTSIASDYNPGDLTPMPIVEHANLKSLVLFGRKDLLPIFTKLTLPAMEKLHLSYNVTTPSVYIFEEFIRRSKPPLRVFSYDQRYCYSRPTSERHDHNVGYLNICSTYFGGIMEEFALISDVTVDIMKMLMERLSDGTHKHIANVKYLDLSVNSIEGGIVSDLIFSRPAIYHQVPRAFKMTKGSGGQMREITLQRNSSYGIGDEQRLKAMEREGVSIRRFAC